MKFDPLSDILDDVLSGRPIVVVDDKDRENEGDIVVAAEKISAETINFMIQQGKGLICLSLTKERLQTLQIGEQVVQNSSPFQTRFAVSIDHHSVLGRGVTAEGRAKTILEAINPQAVPEDFFTPGYVFPLTAAEGGVLKRAGHTEASLDLARLAGVFPAGVICEIMNEQGEMIRGAELYQYCRTHQLKMTHIDAIREYRLRHDSKLRRVSSCEVRPGLRAISFVDDADDKEHIAFVQGEPQDGCLVRVHSECLTGDVFNSLRCDCGDQLHAALLAISNEQQGVVIYLHQEGRGIGLGNKLRAYELQDQGFDTVEANLELGFKADSRDYRAGAQILSDLGLRSVRLMTNNPDKVESLKSFGIEVQQRVELPVSCHSVNEGYLRTKRDRLGHILPHLSS